MTQLYYSHNPLFEEEHEGQHSEEVPSQTNRQHTPRTSVNLASLAEEVDFSVSIPDAINALSKPSFFSRFSSKISRRNKVATSQFTAAPVVVERLQGDVNPTFEAQIDDSSSSESEYVQNPGEAAKLQKKGAKKHSPTSRLSPEYKAGFFSRITFTWMQEIFSISKQRRRTGKELEQEDLFTLGEGDSIERVSAQFQEEFGRRLSAARKNGEKINGSSMLRSTLFSCNRGILITGFFQHLLLMFSTLVSPILLNLFLDYITIVYNQEDQDLEEVPFTSSAAYGYLLAFAIPVALFARTIFATMANHTQARLGFRWKSCISTAVYRKAIGLGATVNTFGTGAIVNYMQLDAESIEDFANAIHATWMSFGMVMGYLVILYFYVDWYAFAGVGAMFGIIPVAMVVVALAFQIFDKKKMLGDERVKTTSEMLQNMLGVKMGAWEKHFEEGIAAIRVKEISLLKFFIFLFCVFVAIIESVPALGAFVAIALYLNAGNDANVSVLFVIINSFLQLKVAFNVIPMVLGVYSAYRVSSKRVGSFLIQEEMNANSKSVIQTTSQDDIAVQMKNATFKWQHLNLEIDSKSKKELDEEQKKSSEEKDDSTKSKQLPVLTSVTCDFKRNNLTAIVGPVGCGKSSLCNAIIGDLVPDSGTVAVEGTIAYAAQTAWMMNATIRDNILFGNAFDPERYAKVLECSQLNKDISLFQHGDQTMIGEKGINLSGGQKQRISIARVAYSTREIVILDDPLSALDPKVANAVFDQCISTFMSDRTRILITNQLNFLKSCDSVVLLTIDSSENGKDKEASGRVQMQGTFDELYSSVSGFAEMVTTFNKTASSSQSNEPSPEGDDAKEEATEQTYSEEDSSADKLMTEEERSRGSVAWKQYTKYFKSGGGVLPIFGTILCAVINQLCVVLNTGWITLWSDAAASNYTRLPPFDTVEEWFDIELGFVSSLQQETASMNGSLVNGTSGAPAALYLYTTGYGVTVGLVAVTAVIPVFLTQLITLRASRVLHERLLNSVMHAPMSFFDTTPLGRIIARFAKDSDELDTNMGQLLGSFIGIVSGLFGALATVISITPWIIVGLVPLSVMYWYVLHIFRPVGRDVKRMEAISRSPVYAQFSETLTGLDTIRAFQREGEFKEDNMERVNKMIGNFYVLRSLERWRQVRIGLVGNLILLGSTILAVVGATTGSVSAGLAGLSLTFAMTFSSYLGNVVNILAELELMMNSVERVFYYSSKIPQEAEFERKEDDSNALKSWPQKGELVVNNLQMRYREDTPLVLKGISFTVSAGSRVGVVGRTGSGKSSLMMCLLRLVEPVRDVGSPGPILIDGVDICTLGLSKLRHHISIVPQHPVVFAGTIRSNLDPLGVYSDAALWNSLERCSLKSFVASNELGLDTKVTDSGSNLSQGQRQLLSLARTVLEEAKVLLLDEATSSIDFETDSTIQSTLRNSSAFQNTTLLVIAHRLNTVMDSDKILVLNEGLVAEYDSPSNLLADPNSTFSSMASEHARD